MAHANHCIAFKTPLSLLLAGALCAALFSGCGAADTKPKPATGNVNTYTIGDSGLKATVPKEYKQDIGRDVALHLAADKEDIMFVVYDESKLAAAVTPDMVADWQMARVGMQQDTFKKITDTVKYEYPDRTIRATLYQGQWQDIAYDQYAVLVDFNSPCKQFVWIYFTCGAGGGPARMDRWNSVAAGVTCPPSKTASAAK